MKLPIEYVADRNYLLFKNDCGITDVVRSGGIYEQYMFDYVRDTLSVEGTTILDIGANLGQHSIEFSKLVGDSGVVHAYEAQRLVFYQLCANVLLHGISNIYAHHLALSDKSWLTHIQHPDYFSTETINVGNSFMAPEPPWLKTRDLVQMNKLDNYGFESPAISVIKIDVEGAEPFVLDGAVNTIKQHRPILFVEIWDVNLGVYKFRPDDVFSRLDALGYTWKKLIDADHIIDYVATPK